jgi:chromosome partitioning protein
MAKTISIFNNKGGVGKTTYMYHVAHMLARRNLKVLMVDCDSQCNLTAYSLGDADIKKAWSDTGNSIYQNIEPVYKTTGDVGDRAPYKLRAPGDLYLIPPYPWGLTSQQFRRFARRHMEQRKGRKRASA